MGPAHVLFDRARNRRGTKGSLGGSATLTMIVHSRWIDPAGRRPRHRRRHGGSHPRRTSGFRGKGCGVERRTCRRCGGRRVRTYSHRSRNSSRRRRGAPAGFALNCVRRGTVRTYWPERRCSVTYAPSAAGLLPDHYLEKHCPIPERNARCGRSDATAGRACVRKRKRSLALFGHRKELRDLLKGLYTDAGSLKGTGDLRRAGRCVRARRNTSRKGYDPRGLGDDQEGSEKNPDKSPVASANAPSGRSQKRSDAESRPGGTWH